MIRKERVVTKPIKESEETIGKSDHFNYRDCKRNFK